MKAQPDPPIVPSAGWLRWLLDPGAQVPPDIRENLLRRLLSSPEAVVLGALHGALINSVAYFADHRLPYLVFALLNLVICVLRMLALRAVHRAAPPRVSAAMAVNVVLSIAWCALEGICGGVAMVIGTEAIRILNCCHLMAMIATICARNYPAPRLAGLLICLLDLPLLVGTCFSGNHLLLVLLPMTPGYIYAIYRIINIFQEAALAALLGQHASMSRARSDQLTGLLNRHGWADAAANGACHLQRDVLMCLDLDGFKAINDTLGHHAGDSLLCGVARRLEESVRRGDLVARFGGDEFVIFAPDLTPHMAQDFADRLIDRLANEPYLLEDMQLVRIGVSIGFACAPDDGTYTEDLHRKADSALYAAKAAGKGVAMRFCAPVPSLERTETRAAPR